MQLPEVILKVRLTPPVIPGIPIGLRAGRIQPVRPASHTLAHNLSLDGRENTIQPIVGNGVPQQHVGEIQVTPVVSGPLLPGGIGEEVGPGQIAVIWSLGDDAGKGEGDDNR